MDYYSGYILKLIEELGRLPGIGPKSAARLAFYILGMTQEQADSLSDSIREAKKHVKYCKQCFTLTDEELCPICRSQERDKKTIMVVETQEIWQHMKRQESMKGVSCSSWAISLCGE
jgi:recombination protein RecR